MKVEGRSFTLQQALVLLPGLGLMLWIVLTSAIQFPSGMHFTLFDDAMISMTYGRTLAESGEWVWYPGAPRVQGFTNPLWTLWMAVLHILGLSGSAASLAISLTSAGLILLTALVAGRSIVRFSGQPAPTARLQGLIATAALPLLFPLTFWSLRGMEVGLLALCAVIVTSSLTLLLSSAPTRVARWSGALGLAFASAMGVATRTDFVVLPLLSSVTALLLSTRRRSSPGIQARIAVSGLVIPVASLGIILGFQSWYWGSALPNTYYVKMTGYDLFTRLERGLLSDGKLAPILLLTTVSLALVLRESKHKSEGRLATIAYVSFLGTIGYSSWVGGDAWETFKMANRYVAVSLPLAVLVLSLAFPLILASIRRLSAFGISFWIFLVTLSGLLVGLETNPVRINWLVGLLAAIALLTTTLLLVMVVRLPAGHLLRSAFAGATGLVLLIVVATGLPRLAISVFVGSPPDAVSDANMTQRGLWLRDILEPRGTVASLWAGAPIYYSERPAVDLLGKSDPYIARKLPNQVTDRRQWNADFFPGHNKWDVEHSILRLRPEVVLNSITTPEERRRISEVGYREFCLPDGYSVLLLSNSPLVNMKSLTKCSDS